MSSSVANPYPGECAVTFDLEDWHPLVARRFGQTGNSPSGRVPTQTQRILELLDRHSAKATFFVLGPVAEAHPEVVGQIHDQGHEVATHGHDHVPLHLRSADDVESDVGRSMDVLKDITGERVRGHRAPEFSVLASNVEILNVLRRLGLEYDSSIFPIRHRRYGIPNFPKTICSVGPKGGRRLIEFPLLTRSVFGQEIPAAGGGYFRVFPRSVLRSSVKRAAKDDRLPVLYFHPYEFDSERLRLASARGIRSWAWHQTQNLGRGRLYPNLEAILPNHKWRPLGEFANACKIASESIHEVTP